MYSTWNPESNRFSHMSKGIVSVPRTEKKLCKKEIEELKQTDLTNGSLNAQWFLSLNPLLIGKIIRGVVVDQL